MDYDHDVMEDQSKTSMTRDDVEARVRDWQQRLHDLFRDVGVWAADHGWRVDDSGTVAMHEDLMRRFDVPATTQPMLRLDGDEGYALFKPKGLWVIGANGRIDLYTPKGIFAILDLAEGGAPPRWTIFRATPNRDGDSFTPEMLGGLV